MIKLNVLIMGVLLLLSELANAFPGMIRHGYVNCTSCHVQPTGGGVLKPYGREISQELLSSFSKENEGKLIYNAFGVADLLPTDSVQIGGDTRLIQTYRDSARLKEERFFLMQSDLEVAAQFGHWIFDVNGGYYDAEFKSLRHYILYQWDEEFSLRGGRFRPAYGMNTPEHTLVIKRKLGWDESTETYNLEAAWLKKGWNLFITGIFGKPESVEELHQGLTLGQTGIAEKGFASRGSIFIHDNYELGLEYYYGTNSSHSRHVMGPFFILGVSPQFYLLSELDFQIENKNSSSDSLKGFFNYEKFSYEPIQGFHLIATTEWSRSQFSNQNTFFQRYGAGIEFYPRPHFEVQALWQKQKQPSDLGVFQDNAWLMMHFYL